MTNTKDVSPRGRLPKRLCSAHATHSPMPNFVPTSAPTAATAMVLSAPVKLPTTAMSEALNSCSRMAVAATGRANCGSLLQIGPWSMSSRLLSADLMWNFSSQFKKHLDCGPSIAQSAPQRKHFSGFSQTLEDCTGTARRMRPFPCSLFRGCGQMSEERGRNQYTPGMQRMSSSNACRSVSCMQHGK